MQNFSNMSFYYLPNPFSFCTYLPLTPSSPEASTLSPFPSDTTYAPTPTLIFSPSLDQSYCQFPEQRMRVEAQVAPQNIDAPIQPEAEEKKNNKIQTSPQEALSNLKKQKECNMKIEQEGSGIYIRAARAKKCQDKKQSKKGRLVNANDHDYIPEKGRTKKQVSKYQVNQNRNVVPNQINQIFSFVQKQNKSGYLAEKLFKKYQHPAQYTLKRFYHYQSQLKNRLGHYSNERSLKVVTELYDPKCETWPQQEQRYYNKICRILIRHFLHEDSIFIIMTSRRMKKEKKSDHLRARRQIASAVEKVLKGL